MSLLLGLLRTAVEKSILHSLSNVEHCLGFVDSFYPFFFSLKGLYQVIYHINTDLNDCLFLPLCVFFLFFFHCNSAISLELQRNCNKEVSRFI